MLRDTNAWAVVNAAGYVRVDDAERDRDDCVRGNVQGAVTLAAACAERQIPLATFSSDLVFDGMKTAPYVERDWPAPLGVYGATKAEAEARVLAILPSALVVRTAAFFGPWDEWNFVTIALRAIAEGVPFAAAADLVVSPTYLPDLVHATLDLLIDGERGIWHLSNPGAASWAEFARMAAHAAGLDASLVHARSHATLGLTAARPAYAALGSERGALMPSLEHALARYVRTRPWERRVEPQERDQPTAFSVEPHGAATYLGAR
jgi:dTDP-4-dehydrorhamnose reductase